MNRWNRLTVSLAEAISGVALFAILVLVMAQVVGREIFEISTTGIIDVTSQLFMPLLVLFGLSVAQRQGKHIQVSALYGKLPAKAQRRLDVFNGLSIAVVCCALIAATGSAALDAYSRGVSTSGEITIPLVVPMSIPPVAFLAFLIVTVAQMTAQLRGTETKSGAAE